MNKLFFITIILAFGVLLRLVIAGFGYTFDLSSYHLVGEIVNSGGNVYKETSRYNYGPVWFIIIGILYQISRIFPDPFLFFRFLVAGLLIGVDIGIWYILYKRYSLKTSLLFFLSPISVIVTGYYSQFDNLAVFLGFLAVIVLKRHFMTGLILLGISLMTKHVFFAFPLWLFFSEKKLSRKVLSLVVPLAIFGMGFLPFLQEGFHGIKDNVFLYKSFNNGPLWQFLVPDYLKRYLRKEFLFFGMLILGGIFFRKKKPFDQLLFYTITLVTFSYAIADQYFAIIVPFIAVYFNLFFLFFVITQFLFFLMVLQGGEVNWFGFFLDRNNFSFTPQIIFLFCGLLFVLYRTYFPNFHFRHLTIALFVATAGLYSFIVIPSWREDRRMQPIINAMRAGNYELANTLYGDIERNPPFAGSRFWYKLSNIRYAIEYYRKYKEIDSLYKSSNLDIDRKKIENDLGIMPAGFPEAKRVQEILQTLKK
jgi:hypothetical protein